MPSPRTIRCNTKTIWWKRTSPWRIEMRPSRGFVLLAVLALAGDLLAGSLEVIVKDDKGRPCSDAVAYAVADAVFSSDEPRRTRRVERSAGRAIHRAGVAPGVERSAGSARPKG